MVGKVFNFPIVSGRSAAWLARLPWEQEVAGSNPAAPTKLYDSAKLSFTQKSPGTYLAGAFFIDLLF